MSTTAPSSPKPTHLAIYTGSFDPITLGHVDVLARARTLFDEIVLAIGHNPEKAALFTMEERAEMAKLAIATGDGASGAAVRVETYEGLTVDFARRVGACAIIRGLRNSTDLATESQLAITNRKIAGIETVFIVSGEEHAYTSSSLIRQMAALGASIEQLSTFVPPVVFDAIRAKQGDAAHPLGAFSATRSSIDRWSTGGDAYRVFNSSSSTQDPVHYDSRSSDHLHRSARQPSIAERVGDRRPGHATTTLLISGEDRILIDPSLPPDHLRQRLDERTGRARKPSPTCS